MDMSYIANEWCLFAVKQEYLKNFTIIKCYLHNMLLTSESKSNGNVYNYDSANVALYLKHVVAISFFYQLKKKTILL